MKNDVAKRRISSGTLFVTLFLTVITVGVVSWELIALPWSDDWFYLYAYCNDPGVGFLRPSKEVIETLGDAWESISRHYMLFNSRLANLTMYLTDLLPQPVTDVINGLMITAMLTLIIINANGVNGLRSPIKATLTATLMWVIMPWHDNLVSIDFQINYVWSSVFALTFFYIYQRQADTLRGLAWWMAAIFVAVAAGWMHEGFSIPMAAGCLWLLLRDRSTSRRNRVLLFGALCLGLCLALGPGTFDRIFNGNEIQFDISVYQWFISRALLGTFPLFAPIAAAAWVWAAKGGETAKRLIGQQSAWIVIAITSFLLGCAVTRLDRTLWIMDISAIVITMRFLAELSLPKVAKRLLVGTLTAANVLFLIFLCRWQMVMAAEQQQMIDLRVNEGVRTLYTSMPMADDAPWYTLGIPHRHNATNRLAQYTFSAVLDTNNNVFYPVLPISCKGKPFEQWPKIAGDNPFRGEYPALYSTDSLTCTITLEVGEPLPSMSPANRLLALINGKSRANHVLLFPVLLWDGDSGAIYQYDIPQLPRTFQNRRFISIDLER